MKKNTKDTKEKTLITKLASSKSSGGMVSNNLNPKNERNAESGGWLGKAFILDKLKAVIGSVVGVLGGVAVGLVGGTLSQINRLFKSTKIGQFTAKAIESAKATKLGGQISKGGSFIKNTKLVKEAFKASSFISKLPVIRNIVSGAKIGYRAGKYIPTTIGNIVAKGSKLVSEVVPKISPIVAKLAPKLAPILSTGSKLLGKAAIPLALAVDAGMAVTKLSSEKGRDDLRKTSDNLDFSKKGKFWSTLGNVLLSPIETITSVGVATKDMFDSNKAAKDSEKALKIAQQKYLEKMANKVPKPVVQELKKLPNLNIPKPLPLVPLNSKIPSPVEKGNAKFKISDIPKTNSNNLNIDNSKKISNIFTKDQSKESMGRLESINTQANQYLQAIAHNTALMVKNFNNPVKQGSPIVINKSDNSGSTSKSLVPIYNNRDGYNSSPYSLA